MAEVRPEPRSRFMNSSPQTSVQTGSAEIGGTNVNSMFVGFAPYDSPTVAISVALEDYDKHDVEAAKIAGIVLTAALAAQGA